MESNHNLNNQAAHDGQLWECSWSTDEIRRNRANWTLAGDVGLFHLLNEFSQNIISRTHEMENAVDSLVHKTKIASVKVNNVMNDFHMLSNLQFVENRVYDEEVADTLQEEKTAQEKTKEQREAEMIPRIIQAVELGLSVLDQAFDRINVEEISDSEDEDLSSEGQTVLEPKDPYENRPLPFIIGSEEFQVDDFAGLKELCEKEVIEVSVEDQSVSESEESSSEEEESLPLDDIKSTEKQNERIAPESVSDNLSSSDESELFGSEKEENGFVSDFSFNAKKEEDEPIEKSGYEKIETKGARQSSVSSMQSRLNLPQVLPAHKTEVKSKDDDLFSNENELSDDESPFRTKKGLFASEVSFASDEKDIFSDDLFGEKPKEKPVAPKPEKKVAKDPVPAAAAKSSGVSLLFDDENSEDDMFSHLTKARVPQIAKPSEKESKESSKKTDSLTIQPSSVQPTNSQGKPFGFNNGGSNSLFGDDSDADDLFSGTKTQKKFDFEAVEDDDLFGLLNEKPSSPKIDIYTSTLSKQEKEAKVKRPQAAAVSKKKVQPLFDDSDHSEQESKNEIKQTFSSPVEKTKDDLSLFGEEDIFEQKTRKSSKVSKLPSVEKKHDDRSLFEDTLVQQSKEDTEEFKVGKKNDVFSLFDDNNVEFEKESKTPKRGIEKDDDLSLFDGNSSKKEVQTSPSNLSLKEQKAKLTSLFEDSDNFDLFSPIVPVEKVEPVLLPKAPIHKKTMGVASSIKSQTSDVRDGPISSKIKEPITVETTKDAGASEISFDIPADSRNTLNVLSKDRVRIATRRRKPTRKARLASLQAVNTDEKSFENTEPSATINNSDSSGPESLSAVSNTTSPPLEKPKMDLMSQLMSELATSNIKRQHTVPKNDSDDEVDIFSTITEKENSTKSDFSFLTPTENSFEPSKLSSNVDKLNEDDKSEVPAIISPESVDNDDFFSEPSFQGFRSSISHVDSVLDLDDDDDDDDLFKTIKNSPLQKVKTNTSADPNDIFADGSDDIFSGLQREKYEMFPSQLYDDEDDIFGISEKTAADKSSGDAPSKLNNTIFKKEPEKKKVNVFDDPLTGLLSDD